MYRDYSQLIEATYRVYFRGSGIRSILIGIGKLSNGIHKTIVGRLIGIGTNSRMYGGSIGIEGPLWG